MFDFLKKTNEKVIASKIDDEIKNPVNTSTKEIFDPLSKELGKCVNLFEKFVNPVLERTWFGNINDWSDKPWDIDFYTKIFSKEEMRGFISLICFIKKHKIEDFHSDNDKELFEKFVHNFYEAANVYFAKKFGTSISFASAIKGRKEETLRDALFIINQNESDLPFEMFFKLIGFDKRHEVAMWEYNSDEVKISCSLNDIIPHLSEKKQIGLCEYLFMQEDKLAENMKYINFENSVGNIIDMIGVYYDYLAFSAEKQKIEKFRNVIFTNIYPAFKKFTLENQNEEAVSDETKKLKAFFTEFFVKELIKNNTLFDFVQEFDPAKSNYMKAPLDERKEIYDKAEKNYTVRYDNISFMIKNYLDDDFETKKAIIEKLDENYTLTTGKETSYINEDEFPEDSKSYDEIDYRP